MNKRPGSRWVIFFLMVITIVLSVSTTIPARAIFTTAKTALISDDFDSENNAFPMLNYNNFSRWNVSNGAFDLIGNGSFDFFPQNGLYVDLDGTVGKPGVLISKEVLSLEANIYYLQFDLAGSQRGDVNTVTVKLGNVYTERFTLSSKAPFRTISRALIVPRATTGSLSFALTAGGGDNIGLLLDNVSLSKNTPPSIIYSTFLPSVRR